MKKSVFLRVLGVVALVLAFLAVGAIRSIAYGATGLTDLVYVPGDLNKKPPVMLVPIEIVSVLPAQKAAHEKIEGFRSLLIARGMRADRDWDSRPFFGKCVVEPTTYSDLRVECMSFSMWTGDDSYVALGVTGSPREALGLIEAFCKSHQERLLRPRPGSGPTLTT